MTERANERFKGITGFDFGKIEDQQRERNGRHIRRLLSSAYGMETSVSVPSGHGPDVRVYIIDLRRPGPVEGEPRSAKGYKPSNGSVVTQRYLRVEDGVKTVDKARDRKLRQEAIFSDVAKAAEDPVEDPVYN